MNAENIRELLLKDGWSEGKLLRLAEAAAVQLSASGLQRDAVLVWLDQIREEPHRFLDDPALADLARLCLHQQQSRPLIVSSR